MTHGRPIKDLSESGLLWLINRVVFHPRGFRLTLVANTETGEATGWELQGDGTEPHWFTEEADRDRFAKAEATLRAAATGERVTLALDDARRLFDLATDSPLICSGSFETDDVVVLRRLAETIGVDPAKATPSEFVRDFPHPFEPFRVDIERNELRDHRAPHGIRWETDDEVYARLGQHPDHCVAGDYNRRCRRPEADPIHHAAEMGA